MINSDYQKKSCVSFQTFSLKLTYIPAYIFQDQANANGRTVSGAGVRSRLTNWTTAPCLSQLNSASSAISKILTYHFKILQTIFHYT